MTLQLMPILLQMIMLSSLKRQKHFSKIIPIIDIIIYRSVLRIGQRAHLSVEDKRGYIYDKYYHDRHWCQCYSITDCRNHHCCIQTIPDYSERLQQLGCDIQNVLSVVQSTDSTVDTIDRTADKVFEKLGDNWMPVDRRLDDIESLVQEAVDAAERARDAAERARDAVESNS